MESTRLTGKIVNLIFAVLLLLIILPLFIPFTPKMPASGVDPSWALGLNQALAQGLAFGKDLIFTLGPYSAIYTKFYHPATDAMMLWGSAYLACAYYLALLLLMRQALWPWRLVFAAFLLTLVYAKDALFFSYPLLVGLLVFHHVQKEKSDLKELGLFIVLFSPLGLLPLIKGSLLLLCGAIAILSAMAFVYYQRYLLAGFALLSSCCSLGLFWLLAGQALVYLIPFLTSSLSLAFSFTEAMSIQGNTYEVFAYLIVSGLILTLLSRANLTQFRRFFLFSLFLVFLFLSFKAGFTRHFGHAFIAGTSLLIAALLLPYCMRSRWLVPLTILSVVTSFYIEGHYRQINLVKNMQSTYSTAWYGLTRRIKDAEWLKTNYKLTMAFLKMKQALPMMPGCSDIYSFEQTELIASGNSWSPRPILQSYSVFNAALAKVNEQHLLSENRPDNLFFKMQPIDERWPSLEDGSSWPIFLTHYKIATWAKDFLILRKATSDTPEGLKPLAQEVHFLGEQVKVPDAGQMIFMRIDLEPSFLGKLARVFFKLPELRVSAQLYNGGEKHYRLIAQMAAANFLLSPLVENTQEFAFLYQDESRLKNKQISSFAVELADDSLSILWANSYTVHFSALFHDGVV